jgi:hypothetical protein
MPFLVEAQHVSDNHSHIESAIASPNLNIPTNPSYNIFKLNNPLSPTSSKLRLTDSDGPNTNLSPTPNIMQSHLASL